MEQRRKGYLEGLIMLALIGSVVYTSPGASAQQSEALSTRQDRQSVAITVYNNNLGLIRERRSLRLPAGRVSLQWTDVPSGIDPTAVQITHTASGGSLSVLEQQYRFDVLTPGRLLEAYVGKQVVLVERRMVNNTEQLDYRQAVLLSTEQNQQVWQIGNEIVINPRYSEIHFPELPKGLMPRPTLALLVENEREGATEVEAAYLTSGLNWEATYILHIDASEALGGLKGWVTVTNQSGAVYENASVNFIAGQIRRVQEKAPPPRYEVARAMAASAPLEEQFAERTFSEYHLYRLGRPISLRDNESKQISLLGASGIKLAKEYVINGRQHYYQQRFRPGEPIKEDVEVALSFRNLEENNLGLALPGGTVRVYRSDPQVGDQFIGEDRIAHTPKEETARVRIGSAFDILAERQQTDYRKIGERVFEYSYEIAIRNRKDESVTIIVNEPITGDWEILSSTVPYEKTGARAAQFTVPVAAQGEATLVYRVRITY